MDRLKNFPQKVDERAVTSEEKLKIVIREILEGVNTSEANLGVGTGPRSLSQEKI